LIVLKKKHFQLQFLSLYDAESQCRSIPLQMSSTNNNVSNWAGPLILVIILLSL